MTSFSKCIVNIRSWISLNINTLKKTVLQLSMEKSVKLHSLFKFINIYYLSKFMEFPLQKSLGNCGQKIVNTLQTLLSRNCTITDGVSKLWTNTQQNNIERNEFIISEGIYSFEEGNIVITIQLSGIDNMDNNKCWTIFHTVLFL